MQLNKIQLYNQGILTYRVSLPINKKSKTFLFRFGYNARGKFWNLTIINPENQDEVISNIPLLETKAGRIHWSFIKQSSYKGIGYGYLHPKTDKSGTYSPNIEKMWNEYELHWVTEE